MALIVSGRRHKYKVKDESGRDVVKVFGYRIVRGGATFIIPFEWVIAANLGTGGDIKTTQPVPSQEYIGMMVDGVANIKIGSDDVSVATAAEQFLGWKQADIAAVAMQVLEGNMREIIGRMTISDLGTEPGQVCPGNPAGRHRRHEEHGPGHRQPDHPEFFGQ